MFAKVATDDQIKGGRGGETAYSREFKSTGQDLVYASAVQIGNFKSPSFIFNSIPYARNFAELLKQKAGKRLIGPRDRKGNPKQVCGFDRRHPSRDQIRAIVALYRSRLGGPVFRMMKGADDRFKDVSTRYEPLENAILVVHQPHVNRRIAQDRNDISSIERFWYCRRFAHQISKIRGHVREVYIKQILGVHNAYGAFSIAIKDDQTGVLAIQNVGDNLGGAIGQINGINFVTRGHYRPYGKIAESHHPGDHFLFAWLQDTRGFRLGNQGSNFIFTDFIARLLSMAQQPQQYLSGSI